MVRLIAFIAVASLFTTISTDAVAQKGGGKGGGSQGGQQCQKGQQTSQTTPNYSAAMQQGYAMLGTLVSQIQSKKITSTAAQALVADWNAATQVAQSTTLTLQQKEAQLVVLMAQALADLQALSTDSSLTSAQQTAVATAASKFQQLTALASQSTASTGNHKKGPGGSR